MLGNFLENHNFLLIDKCFLYQDFLEALILSNKAHRDAKV